MSVAPATTEPTTELQQPGNAPEAEKPKSGDDKRFSQAELDAIVQDRLAREQKKREQAEEKARKEAADAALKEQQEWQKLADQREKRIAELEPLSAQLEAANEQATRYKDALTKHLTTQRSTLPEHITSLLDKLDPVDQLEWIAANQEAIAQPARGNGGVPPTPRANGNLSRDQQIEQEIAAQRQRRFGR